MNARRETGLVMAALLVGVLLPVIADGQRVPPAVLADSTNITATLGARFEPEKPTVVIDYDVEYRFLFLRLMSLAYAHIETTEGHWVTAAGRRIPACFVEATFRSRRDKEDSDNGRIRINNRYTSVLTMPDLDTLYYVKEADEHLNPLFRKPVVTRYVDLYDLEGGRLDYYHRDYVTGTVKTNMQGAAELTRQAQNVSNFIKILSSIYYGKKEMLNPEKDYRIAVNIDGTVKPFTVTTRRDEMPGRFRDRRIDALRVMIRAAREAADTSGKMTVWTASFEDLARQTENNELSEVARISPAWSMVPLMADYGLKIGFIRCSLTDIAGRNYERMESLAARSRTPVRPPGMEGTAN